MATKQTHNPEAPVAKLEHPSTSFEQFLEENLKTLLIAGGVIFVAVIGYLAFTYFQHESAAEEANAFTKAKTVADYRKIISEYPDSLAAGNAQLMIAKLLADEAVDGGAEEESKRREAIGELRTYIETYSDHPQRDQGIFQLGVLAIKDGDNAEAASQFGKLIQEFPDSYLTPYAKLYKGDFAFADGNEEEALKLYNEVLTTHSGTQAARLADQRVDRAKLDPPVIREAPEPPEPATTAPGAGANTSGLPSTIARPESAEDTVDDGAEPGTEGEGASDDIQQEGAEESDSTAAQKEGDGETDP